MVPDWMIQTAVTGAIGLICWFLRGLREDVNRNDKDRCGDIDAIRLDLAKNYVTHKQLRGLRNDVRQALQMMSYLQVELARHFRFKPFVAAPDPGSEFDQESDRDGD